MADIRPTPGQNPYDTSWWDVSINPDGTLKPTLDQIPNPTGSVSMAGQKLTALATPVAPSDAVTKAYADALAVGLNIKSPVVAATTANITLSGTQTIDGVAVVATNRVLVKNQTTGADNGIYTCAAGAWSRATDADVDAEVTSGMAVLVTGGTVQAGQVWVLQTANPITVGTTALVFVQFTAANSGIPLSTVTTKGDLVTATGSAAVTRRPVGSAGQILTANPAQTDGIEWAAPPSSNTSPWATTLAAPISSTATTFTITNALPVTAMIGGVASTYVYVIVDAWTAGAELARVLANAAGTTLTVNSPGFARTHPAGASVVLIEDSEVHPEWFGAGVNNPNATANTAAFNSMFGQLNAAGIGNPGVLTSFHVRGTGGYYNVNSEIGIGDGVASFSQAVLVAAADYGAGQCMLNLSNPPLPTPSRGYFHLHDVICYCSVALPAWATFVAGGSVPWVQMDAFKLDSRTIVERCYAYGVRRGFFYGYSDHGTMRDCAAGRCYDAMYFRGSTNAGDSSYTRFNADSNYRSSVAFGDGANQPQGSSFYNCSWTNSPWAMYFEGSSSCLAITFEKVNTEFLGNGFAYIAAGAVTLGYWRAKDSELANDGLAFGGAWLDSHYPTGFAFYNASATQPTFTNFEGNLPVGQSWKTFGAATAQWRLTNNDFKLYSAGFAVGLGTLIVNGFGAVGGGYFENFSNRFTLTSGYSTSTSLPEAGVAGMAYRAGTVTRGDLVERVEDAGTSPCVQRYQTAGAAPHGVSLLNGSNGMLLVMGGEGGYARINIGTATSIAIGKYLKPDAAHSGCVVAAADYSDGPIVGRAMQASETGSATKYLTANDNTVLAKLMT